MSKEKIQELKNRIEGVKANAASDKLKFQRIISYEQNRKNSTTDPSQKISASKEIAHKKSEMKRIADSYKREIEFLKASIANLK